MKTKITHMIILMLSGWGNLQAQKWTVYNTSNSGIVENGITDIAIDGQNNKWVATWFGLSSFNGTTKWITYDTYTSGIISNMIYCIAIDKLGNKWIGTENGLSKFDGTNWTNYTPVNSGIARTKVLSIAVDGNGNIWFGHDMSTISKFDGTNWTYYPISYGSSNYKVNTMAVDGGGTVWFSLFGQGLFTLEGNTFYHVGTKPDQLYDPKVYTIKIDVPHAKGWFGTEYSLTLLNSSNWIQYDLFEHNVITDGVSSIDIDSKNNVWFGGSTGLVKFDGVNFETFDTHNSGLPDDNVSKIVIDKNGIFWMGVSNMGLVKYNPNDKSGIEEPKMVHTVQMYPNPTTDKLFIKGTNSNSQVWVFNTNGQIVLTQEMTSNTLDVSDLVAGLYSIHIIDANGVSIHKIVKK